MGGKLYGYSIDELKFMLKLKDQLGKEPEQFERMNDLKMKVLDIAVNHLNDHTDLTISYNLVKQGRAFNSVWFYILTMT